MQNRKLGLLAALLIILLFTACESSGTPASGSGTANPMMAESSPAQQDMGAGNPPGNFSEQSVVPNGTPAGQYDNLSQRPDGSIVFSVIDTNGHPHAYVTSDAGTNWQEVDNSDVIANLGMDVSPTSISATVDGDGNWWIAGVRDSGSAAVLCVKPDGTSEDHSSAIGISSPFIEEILQDGQYIVVRYSTQSAIYLTVIRQSDGVKVTDIELTEGVSVSGANARSGKVYGFDYAAQKIVEADLSNGTIQVLADLPIEALPDGLYVYAYSVGPNGDFYVVNANGIGKLDGETLSVIAPYNSGSYDNENQYQSLATANLLVADDGSLWLAASNNGAPCLYRYAP